MQKVSFSFRSKILTFYILRYNLDFNLILSNAFITDKIHNAMHLF